MKKKVLVLFLALILVVSFGACSKSSETAADSVETETTDTQEASQNESTETETEETVDVGEPITLVFSSCAVPSDAHAEAQEVFKQTVESLSDGNITVEVYNNSTLFNQDNMHAALLDGDVDIIYEASSFLATGSPWLSMFMTAYLFNDYDHMKDVLNGEIGQNVFKRVEEEQGMKVLNSFYLGARVINTREDISLITSTADLNGLNLRVPNANSWIKMGEALGASPTPVAYSEVYLALQTGSIDGQDNPLPTTYNAKFYEVAPCINITNHLMADVWPVMNIDKWNSLSQQQQEWIIQAIKVAGEYCDSTNLQREANLISTMEEEGVTFYYPDTAVLAKEVLAYYLTDTEYTASWDMDLFQQIRDMA